MQFLGHMVKRVDYFDKCPDDILFDVILSLKQLTFQKESLVLGVGQNVESIYFIEEGLIETSTDFENNSFVVDILGPGSVIN